MQIREERHSDVQVVTIDDHLDTVAAPLLETALMKLIDKGEHRIVIDCSSLEYVNSAGLKVLLLVAKKLDAVGGKFVLCGLAPNVLMVFEMIGFDRIMKIVGNRGEAVRSLIGAAVSP